MKQQQTASVLRRMVRHQAITAWHRLGPPLLAFLDPQVTRRLDPAVLEQLNLDIVACLAPAVLEQLNPAVLEQLEPAVLEQLSPTALERLTPAVLEQIPPATLEQLPPTILEQLPPTALERLPPTALERLPPATLERLPPTMLEQIDPTLLPPLGYTRPRADVVYGEAFRRCIEYITGTGIQGHILEFGTLRGYTARLMATLMQQFRYPGALYLYDSFEGLPEITSSVDQASYEVRINKVWFQGSMALEEEMPDRIFRVLSKIVPPEQIHITKGFFEETLPTALPAGKAALIHVDCDMYTSTVTVLEQLLKQDLLQDGCVLLFDDYNCNRANPAMGERRAFAEVFGAQERFSYSPFFPYGWHGQAFFVHDHQPPAQPFMMKYRLVCGTLPATRQFASDLSAQSGDYRVMVLDELPIHGFGWPYEALEIYYDSTAGGDPTSPAYIPQFAARLAAVREQHPQAEIRHLAHLITHNVLDIDHPVGVYGYPGSGNVFLHRLLQGMINLHKPPAVVEQRRHLEKTLQDHWELQQHFFRHLSEIPADDVTENLMVCHRFGTLNVLLSFHSENHLHFARVPTRVHCFSPVYGSHEPFQEDIPRMLEAGYRVFLIKRHPLDTLLSCAAKSSTNPEHALDDPLWFKFVALHMRRWYEERVFPVLSTIDVVSYETLMQGPPFLQELARDLDIAMNTEQAQALWEEYAFQPLVPSPQYRHFWKGGSGKWQHYFKPHHVEVLQRVGFFSIFPTLGYDLPESVAIDENFTEQDKTETMGIDVSAIAGKRNRIFANYQYIHQEEFETEFIYGDNQKIRCLSDNTELLDTITELLQQPGWYELLLSVLPE